MTLTERAKKHDIPHDKAVAFLHEFLKDSASEYLVSIVLFKHDGGKINVQNKLYLYGYDEASSLDEAVGKAALMSREDFPNHHINTICKMQLIARPELGDL